MIDLRTRGNGFLQSFLKIGKKLGASKKETKQAFSRGEQSYAKFKKEWADRINRLPTKDLFHLDIPTPSVKNVSPPLGFESQRLVGRDEGEGDGSTSSPWFTLSLPKGPPPPLPCGVEEPAPQGKPSPIKGGGKDVGKTSLRVAFVGHPYNLFDTDINKDVLTLTKNMGIEILTSDLLSEKEIDREISDLSKEIYWSSGREIVGALFHFLKGGVDGVVFLTSFKCGIDALLQEFIKRSLKGQRRTAVPFLVLSFDEHTGREGLVTRLEAFRDVMESRKGSQAKV
jgi:predicted nucleotide-binding protein (sugar kinase/HSP70/actin superfamily)